MNGSPRSDLPKSNTRTIPGSMSFAADCASRSSRSVPSASAASERISFSATSTSRSKLRARHTAPIPPSPSRLAKRYLPAMRSPALLLATAAGGSGGAGGTWASLLGEGERRRPVARGGGTRGGGTRGGGSGALRIGSAMKSWLSKRAHLEGTDESTPNFSHAEDHSARRRSHLVGAPATPHALGVGR